MRRLRAAGLSLIVACCALTLAACGDDDAGATPESPAISTDPGLTPAFNWRKSDYVVRCENRGVTVSVDSPDGWRAAVGRGKQRSGSFEVERPLGADRSFRVTFTSAGDGQRQFHVRCLPNDFPGWKTTGPWRAAPRLTVIELDNRYAVAVDRHGTPVWWYQAPDGDPGDVKILPDNTIAYAPISGFISNHYVIRTLGGRHLHSLYAGPGLRTDSHDVQLLPNGNYMIGSHRKVPDIDTRKFGGSRHSTIDAARLEELTPTGKVVWKWDAFPRIALRETGRWWKMLAGRPEAPYDVNHWNSVDVRGNRVLLSFRHLDAVYCIDRRSGRILWKVGGVKTPKSLRILGDDRPYSLGGQHDARFSGRNAITIFDNATNLKPARPRAVRFRIDTRRRTATLTDQVSDPRVKFSVGFGSARLARDGSWTIGWGAIGKTGVVGVYDRSAAPSRLINPTGTSYRANTVVGPAPPIRRLRAAMDQAAARRK